MTRAFISLAFTPSVRAVQARYGVREHNERAAAREPDRASLSDEMQQRIGHANSVIVGTASRDGWPYVQHRGGPPGFIKVLGPSITVGNLAENNRIFLLLLDYRERTRLKIWGRAEAIEDNPELLERVRDPDYKARVERVIRVRVEAWDTNCTSHIPHLVPAPQDEAARNG
jgi:uncharacterized protein